jgi:hypothetical protein
VLIWLGRGGSSFPPLPNPNGYDNVIAGASRITRLSNSPASASTEELTQLVALNQAALEEIRRGLKLPCAVPVSMDYSWMAGHSTHLMALKKAAQAFACEMELHRRNGDSLAALETGSDLLKMSQAGTRHGVLITSLVGTACAAIAMGQFTNMLATLDANGCRRAAQILYQHDREREPFEETIRHEREWSRRTYGLWRYVMMQAMEAFSKKNPARQTGIEQGQQLRVRQSRQLMLRLAVRAFTLEQGRPPKQASELVPNLLPALPLDPATDQPMDLP